MADFMAAVPEPGGYFSLAKVITMVVLVVPWLYAAPYMSRDAKKYGLNQTTWSLVVVGLGTLGLLLWFVVPMFIVGLIAYLALAAGSLLAYASHRDSKVPEEHKILRVKALVALFGIKEKQEVIEVVSDIKIYGWNSRIIIPPESGVADKETIEAYNLAQQLLRDLVWRRASEADLSPSRGRSRLRLVIDGVLTEQAGLDAASSEAVIQFLKLHGGMDVDEHRRPQQGTVAIDLHDQHVDIDLTVAGTTSGQRMQFRVQQEAVKTSISELGMASDVLERVRDIAHAKNGLFIVSGRAKNGVTSTLYSMLRDCDAFTRLLFTIESKPEVDLENITQNKYSDDSELPTAIGTAVRRDPDVILIDKCKNTESAAIIADAAEVKNIILGMHAADTFTALAKWLKVSGKPKQAMKNLKGVLCQVLVRKLCISCREAYRPDQQLLAKANLLTQKIDKFYRPPTQPLLDKDGNPITCQACQGSGFVGRTAAFELLEINDDIRHLVLSGATLSQIRSEARKARMLYLQERALQKVITGETSIKEVIRVTKEAAKK